MAKIFTGKEYLDEEFYGRINLQEILFEIKNLFSHTNEIGQKLKNSGNLPQEYVVNVFRDLNKIKAHEATEEGYRKMNHYKRILRSIQNKTWRYKNEFIHPHICKFIEENPTNVDEEFFAEYYLIQMFEMLAESALDDFLGDISEMIESPFKRKFYQNITEEIVDKIGEHEMNKFNKKLLSAMVITPTVQLFMQGFIDALIENLIIYDPENGKYMFEYKIEI